MKKVAIMYDFDGTLASGNMQEYDFIPALKIKAKEFWEQAMSVAKAKETDPILAYMWLMIDKAYTEKISIHKKDFQTFGKNISLFNGVDTWFERINKIGSSFNLSIEHYIVSSGIKEMIEGTKIAKKFKRIYASSFMYDHNGVAVWPALALNYTSKTQFIFRINKGVFDVFDNTKINDYQQEEKRHIPFKRMIYIGDGLTDVPCMKLVKEKGGFSIAVYDNKIRGAKKQVQKLIQDNRVNYINNTDYSEGSNLEKKIETILHKIKLDIDLKDLEK
jgi:2-hydroxy-3-keto-5-methylthiopentenyl-1-phosphate phosphatase